MIMIKAWHSTILSAAYLGLATASRVIGLSTTGWDSGGSRVPSHVLISWGTCHSLIFFKDALKPARSVRVCRRQTRAEVWPDMKAKRSWPISRYQERLRTSKIYKVRMVCFATISIALIDGVLPIIIMETKLELLWERAATVNSVEVSKFETSDVNYTGVHIDHVCS
jgi:hypothetical protein